MSQSLRRILRPVSCLVLIAALGACAKPQNASDIIDPLEPANRGVHTFNKTLDKAVLRDVSRAYVTVVPEPVVDAISNATHNLEQPSRIMNNLLQGRVENAAHNSFRFLVNTTFGLLGVLDVADAMGLEEIDTDFGETLYVWGVGEGAYLEVPLLGPHTSRRLVGRAVDIVTDPIGEAVSFTRPLAVRAGLYTTEQLKDRAEFSNVVDDVLYNSIDSYSATRIFYLQNRRFMLGSAEGPDYLDPYELSADGDGGAAGAADDLYFDPYEDPYAQ